MQRRSFLGAMIAPAFAFAQDWPARPIRMVIGYPAGGSTDVAGRLLAEALGRTLGQQIIVDNRAGAGGTMAAASVVRAEPDGHTLLLAASPEVSIAPITVKALGYDPTIDLAPISMVGQIPFLLVVNSSLPVNTLQEFIAFARANPGKLFYSSFGNNTSNHLNGELLKSLVKIDTVHVPYKGSNPSIVDLIGGQVQYTLDGPPAVLEHVRAGKLRALAVAAAKRLPSLPHVPTFAEAGGPELIAGTWLGLLAPKKTPAAVIQRLQQETSKVLGSSELFKALTERSILASSSSPEAFGKFIRSENERWKQLSGKLHIVAE